MSVTIFGPQARTRFVVRSSERFIEVARQEIADHFEIDGPFSLFPATLGAEDLKLECLEISFGHLGFVLDSALHIFYKVQIESVAAPDVVVLSDEDCGEDKKPLQSVLDLIRLGQPKGSSLHVALSSALKTFSVEELPTQYDGYVAYELPPSEGSSSMIGMEHRFDGHVWADYVTCKCDCFPGVVRLSRCAGHLRCYNTDCSHVLSSALVNETHWVGKLKKYPPVGAIRPESGSLVCKHCRYPPVCLQECPCVMYYCIPYDHKNITRCAIHMGFHDHPCAQGVNRGKEKMVSEEIGRIFAAAPHSTPKQVEVKVAQDLILNRLVADFKGAEGSFSDADLNELLATVTPLNDRRRIQRCVQEVKISRGYGSLGFEAVLALKQKIGYPFIHSILFPGQLNTTIQPHVFKMSTLGPGSGVDLVNRMRPGGNLQDMWVHFDHVHRVTGWSTMAAHVYDPFVKELLTIATCEFKVEDSHAQEEFWRLLNTIVKDGGFQTPEFRGFMADEASANWNAIRKVYFNGERKPDKERSCSFHWEQSMIKHTKGCIKAPFQEHHKVLCRQWKNAESETIALTCRQTLQQWWRKGHAIEGEISALETWLSWWEVRAAHWSSWFLTQEQDGPFLPTTNLAETKHSSMRAAVGFQKHLSIYEATAVDLTMAVLQSAHCNAYIVGGYSRTGPGLKDIKDRFLSKKAGPGITKRLIDMTHNSMQEFNCKPNEGMVEQTSKRHKRPASSSPRIVLENDSHRPEYVTTTVSKNRKMTKLGSLQTPQLQVKERDVAKTLWAIRRTEIGSKVTCFGFLNETKARCGQLVNQDGARKNIGRPAPSFWGRRAFPGAAGGSGGVREGFVWFCATSITHSWNVDTTWIIAPPGHAPGVWPIARGTNLTNEEICSLQECGFVLETEDVATNSGPSPFGNAMGQSLGLYRPKYRAGKAVRWRSKLTKEFMDNIEKGRSVSANLVKEDIVLCNEAHLFYVSTPGSLLAGVHYVVSISEFPSCSCPDFQKREAKHGTFVPCKHMYYIFLRVLNLDAQVHEFMHQAALSKTELFQALSGRRYHGNINI